MGLSIHDRLGPYEVTDRIGAGGMGLVYAATDHRLDRVVALKVLPDTGDDDRDRRARFHREAKALAKLCHPNIGAIYGFEHSGETAALVLELVPGVTLQERIAQGPLPLGEAVSVAVELARGLEAAHAQDIVHRDLKPANIKLTPGGRVKILDFGLAKVVPSDAARTATGTERGMVVGTAGYMSPEQARGKPVDKRADIWAFGCVLFEMLTGRPAFRGETRSDILAKVLEREPGFFELPPDTPPDVQRLVRRCLDKDPRRRLRDIGDALIALEEVARSGASAPEVNPTGTRAEGWSGSRARLAGGVIIVLAGVYLSTTDGSVLGALRRAPATPMTRSSLLLPADHRIPTRERLPITISDDGSSLVYVAGRNGHQQLYLRPLDGLVARAVPGTEGAVNPFFSPDGQWIGFWAGGAVRKVSVHGGPPIVLCDSAPIRGATWSAQDNIVFGTTAEVLHGLWQVSADGGTPQPLTALDAESGDISHRFPEMLPNGSVLFTVVNKDGTTSVAVRANEGQTHTLVADGSLGRYAATGHLIYVQGDALWAMPFDAEQLTPRGEAVPVLDGLKLSIGGGGAQFDFASNGLLVYGPGGAPMDGSDRVLMFVDRDGQTEPLTAIPGGYAYPRLSPDGSQVGVVIADDVQVLGSNADLWVHEIERGTRTRLTSTGTNRYFPAWTPDGEAIAFGAQRTGSDGYDLYHASAHGDGPAQPLLSREHGQFPTSWSPDGKTLAFYESHPDTLRDLWVWHVGDGTKPEPLLATPFQERAPTFSPDGRWLAYVSDASGRDEVYVLPVERPHTAVTVSTTGGTEPVWSDDGDELFYRNHDEMMAVTVKTTSIFEAGVPRVLFTGDYDVDLSGGGLGGVANFDVTSDGQRFVMVAGSVDTTHDGPVQLVLVHNWFRDLADGEHGS